MRGGCHTQSYQANHVQRIRFFCLFPGSGSDKLFKSSQSVNYLQQGNKKIITEYTDIKGVNTQKSKLIVVLGKAG